MVAIIDDNTGQKLSVFDNILEESYDIFIGLLFHSLVQKLTEFHFESSFIRLVKRLVDTDHPTMIFIEIQALQLVVSGVSVGKQHFLQRIAKLTSQPTAQSGKVAI